MTFILSYHFYFVTFGCYLLESSSFLMRDRKNLEERKSEEELEIKVKIYYLRKELIFSKRKKIIKQQKKLRYSGGSWFEMQELFSPYS